MGITLASKQLRRSPQRYRYTSLRLVEVLWRGPGLVMTKYTAAETRLPLIAPGQFILFWVPGLEAIPLSPVYSDEANIVLLVKERGETTKSIVHEPPVFAGAIAPLGTPIQVPRGHVVVLAGGVGIASALPVARTASMHGDDTILVYGARSREELAPVQEYIDERVEIVYATEDGSKGVRGTVIDALNDLGIRDAWFYAAGPNPMLCALYRWAQEKDLIDRLYMAPERIVRCGMGFCGRCVVTGTRLLLCRDGAYIAASKLREWVEAGCPID